MVTVKMMLSLLKRAKEIRLVWNGYCKTLDPEDVLDVDVFGRYVVDCINNVDKDIYEVYIAFAPIKAPEE